MHLQRIWLAFLHTFQLKRLSQALYRHRNGRMNQLPTSRIHFVYSSHYSTPEQECYGFVKSVTRLRHIIAACGEFQCLSTTRIYYTCCLPLASTPKSLDTISTRRNDGLYNCLSSTSPSSTYHAKTTPGLTFSLAGQLLGIYISPLDVLVHFVYHSSFRISQSYRQSKSLPNHRKILRHLKIPGTGRWKLNASTSGSIPNGSTTSHQMTKNCKFAFSLLHTVDYVYIASSQQHAKSYSTKFTRRRWMQASRICSKLVCVPHIF